MGSYTHWHHHQSIKGSPAVVDLEEGAEKKPEAPKTPPAPVAKKPPATKKKKG